MKNRKKSRIEGREEREEEVGEWVGKFESSEDRMPREENTNDDGM